MTNQRSILNQFINELAHLRWKRRGKPLSDDYDDWFWAEKTLSLFLILSVIFLAIFLIYKFQIVGYFLGITALIFAILSYRKISGGKSSLILFLVFLLIIGPTHISKIFNALEDRGGSFSIANFISITVAGSHGGTIEEKVITKQKAKIANIEKSISRQRATKNIINNGDFAIPLGDKTSKWGHGFHSDRLKAMYPGTDFTWINLLNADITISVEKTELGNALKIIHRSERIDDKIGFMEQRLQVAPGKYRLSFWAKALGDFEAGGLWVVNNNEWVITKDSGYSLDKKGPFGWEYFFKEIEIDKNGDMTFSIVSIGKGTVYITDISLIKQ